MNCVDIADMGMFLRSHVLYVDFCAVFNCKMKIGISIFNNMHKNGAGNTWVSMKEFSLQLKYQCHKLHVTIDKS